MGKEDLEQIWDSLNIVDGEPRPFTAREMRDQLNAALLPRFKVDENYSDGYHTFKELYEHRIVLFMALMKSHPDISWYSRYHSDWSNMEGWFIAGMDLPTGTVTYHLPMSEFENMHGKLLERAPEWDGHTPADVVKRLKEWIS